MRRSLTAFTTTMLTGLAVAAMSASALAQNPASDRPQLRVTTNLGAFVIEMNPERAPLTVEHVLEYVRAGYYDGTVFHRVVQGFVAQGGGYTPDLELREATRTVFNESGNGLSNLRGTVGMARTTEPHSATSQFYVNLADNPDLNPRPTRWGYAVFGTVTEGMEVVDRIGHRVTSASGPFQRDVPVEPIIIERVEVIGE
jgi:cyclophilin family peptidyl-prolyl cis-trans isomerase